MKNDLTWVTQASNIASDHILVPEYVRHFLEIVLTGRLAESSTQRVQRLVTSYGQDLIHGVSRGQVKTPEHVLLPMAVKTLTGNVQLIQLLNRFGHGLSYSQCEEIETSLCLNKMAKSSESGITLPDSIQQFSFTSLVWDNIDRLEETLSGAGTSHRVNGIIIMVPVY